MKRLIGVFLLMVAAASAQSSSAPVKVGLSIGSNRERIQKMLPSLQERLQKELSGKSGFTVVAAEKCSDCKYIVTIDVTQHNLIEASLGNTNSVGEHQPVDEPGSLFIKYEVEDVAGDSVVFKDSMSLPPKSEPLGPDFQQLETIVRNQVSAVANQALKKLKKKEKH